MRGDRSREAFAGAFLAADFLARFRAIDESLQKKKR
jgi:hypothetical protein